VRVSHFVVTPMNSSGHSIESQITPTGQDLIGGLQFEVVPAGYGPDEIIIFVRLMTGVNETSFKVKTSTRMQRVMDTYYEAHGLVPQGHLFWFEGSRVQGG
jgi:hypothetical protein